ncbi:MAG: guanylate kinase [Deltaproteobacteria bacterium]|nr:MAG: guanylate kinase [Deltaproteobacteria bacterium]
MSGQLFVITGPSGVGKSTIIKRLRKTLPRIGYSVSHTSRKPRKNEADGINYHFVDRQTFEKMIEEKAFVEWAEVYHDLYGTSFSSLQSETDQGLDVVMDLDSEGAKNIKGNFEDSVLIYILPPSFQVLEKRLRGRASDDEAEIKARLEEARKEIQNCIDYDYIIFNEDLNRTVEEVNSIIVSSRCRKSKRLSMVEKTFGISIP